MGPTQPVTDPTSATGFYNWPGNSLQSADNPAEILGLATDKGTTYRSIGNVQASYRMPFLEALTANANLGYDLTEMDRSSFNPRAIHCTVEDGDRRQPLHDESEPIEPAARDVSELCVIVSSSAREALI